MSTTIDQALYTKLTSTTAITSLVAASRITRGFKRNDAGLPAIIFFRSASTPFGTSSGTNQNWDIEFEVTIEADTIESARTIADTIAAALRGWKSTDPASGPFRMQADADSIVNPSTGENYSYGRIVQDYKVTLKI